jgi:hypothetical protein
VREGFEPSVPFFFVSKIEEKALSHLALNGRTAVLFALLGGASVIAVSLPADLLAVRRALTTFPEARATLPQLPFSFEDTVSYFSGTLGGVPRQLQSEYAFFETATSAEATLQVAVMRQGSQMLLRFRFEDENGLAWCASFAKRHSSKHTKANSFTRFCLRARVSTAPSCSASMSCANTICAPERTIVSFFSRRRCVFAARLPRGLECSSNACL